MGTGEVRFIGTVVEVNEDISIIEIDQRFCPGLDQLDSYSELDVLFWFHFRDDDKHRKGEGDHAEPDDPLHDGAEEERKGDDGKRHSCDMHVRSLAEQAGL